MCGSACPAGGTPSDRSSGQASAAMPGRHVGPFWRQQPAPPATASPEVVGGPSRLQQRAPPAASAVVVEGPSRLQQGAPPAVSAVEGADIGPLQQDSPQPEPSSASMAAAAALLGLPPVQPELSPLLRSPAPQQQEEQQQQLHSLEASSTSMAAAATLLGPPPTPLQLLPLLLTPEPQEQQQPSIQESRLPQPEQAELLLSFGDLQLAEQLMIMQQPSGLSHEPQNEQQLLGSTGAVGPGAGTAAAEFPRQPLADATAQSASKQVGHQHSQNGFFCHYGLVGACA